MATTQTKASPLFMLLKPDQRRRLEKAAKRAELPLSTWARQVLLDTAARTKEVK